MEQTQNDIEVCVSATHDGLAWALSYFVLVGIAMLHQVWLNATISTKNFL